MHELLQHLESQFDLIVVDAPPALLVADVMALLQQVSGVVIVGRLRHTRRDDAGRLRRELARLNVSVLGLVVNGDITKDAAYYGYAYSAGTGAVAADK
jgi:non-specific protein-tyrosine kinase